MSSVVNLKRDSRQLYKKFKDSLFKRVSIPGNVTPSNSWDAVPGGTATRIGRTATRIGRAATTSNVQEVEAFEIEDQERYMYQRLTKLMDKPIYKRGYPSRATLAKWKKPMAGHFKTGGPDFNKRYDDTARLVYRNLFSDQPVGYTDPGSSVTVPKRRTRTPVPRFDPSDMGSSSETPPVKTKKPTVSRKSRSVEKKST